MTLSLIVFYSFQIKEEKKVGCLKRELNDLTPFIPLSWEERGRDIFEGAEPLQTAATRWIRGKRRVK